MFVRNDDCDTTSLLVPIDKDLKKRFKAACKKNHIHMATLLRTIAKWYTASAEGELGVKTVYTAINAELSKTELVSYVVMVDIRLLDKVKGLAEYRNERLSDVFRHVMKRWSRKPFPVENRRRKNAGYSTPFHVLVPREELRKWKEAAKATGMAQTRMLDYLLRAWVESKRKRANSLLV